MRRTLCVLALLSCLGACSKDSSNTKIVVVVWSDLAVQTQLDSVRIDATGPTQSRSVDFPLSATGVVGKSKLPIELMVARADNSAASFDVTAIGLLGRVEVGRQEARLSFVPGETRGLTLYLWAACSGVACVDGMTCDAGQCNQPVAVDSAKLPAYDPSHLPPPPDASVAATPSDASDGGTAPDVSLGGDVGGRDGNADVPSDQRIDFATNPQHCGALNRVCSTTRVSGSPICSGGLCKSACRADASNFNFPAAPAADDGCETLTCALMGPSCAGGPSCKGESCCKSRPVPGGTYNRGDDPSYPASVSDFCMDKYEVTVGRFRKFVNDYDRWISVAGGSHPFAGEGEHVPKYGSGWQPTWKPGAELPASAAVFKDSQHLKCDADYPSFTEGATGNETLPINCVDWYEAFAFCIWDGGRLATESEWEYVAGHGSENLLYPWGNAPVLVNGDLGSNTYAVFGCQWNRIGPPDCPLSDLAPVGSAAAGNGFWGHADLAGNLREWVFDWHVDPFAISLCNNCAAIAGSSTRETRGGDFVNGAGWATTVRRSGFPPTNRGSILGIRCVRSAPP